MHRKEITCQNANVDEFIDWNEASKALVRKNALRSEKAGQNNKRKKMLVDGRQTIALSIGEIPELDQL